MPGFLSASGYEGDETIDLGNGYWVKVKRCLSAAEMTRVENTMGAGRQRIDVSGGGRQFTELDIRGSWTEMVVESLVAWNIDDEDGTVWSLEPEKGPYSPGCVRRQSVARLPDPVFKLIWQRCDELNAPRKGPEAASFPEQAVGGDPDGDAGAAGPVEVPDGTGVLEAAGPV